MARVRALSGDELLGGSGDGSPGGGQRASAPADHPRVRAPHRLFRVLAVVIVLTALWPIFIAMLPPSESPTRSSLDAEAEAAWDAARRRVTTWCPRGGQDDVQLQDLRRVVADGNQATTQVIFFIGDSTLRQQMDQFCILLGVSLPDRSPGKVITCKGTVSGTAFTLVYMGTNTLGWHRPDAIEAMSAVAGDPTAIYFNGGLHWLHLLPIRDFTDGVDGFNVWDGAETLVPAFLSAAAKTKATIVFMTNHWICERRFIGWYHLAISAVHWPNQGLGHACRARLEHSEFWGWTTFTIALVQNAFGVASEPLALNTTELGKCERSLHTDFGVELINARVLEAIRAWRGTAEGASVPVRVVDGFSITKGRCDATGVTDGRHYATLIPTELKSMLQCLK